MVRVGVGFLEVFKDQYCALIIQGKRSIADLCYAETGAEPGWEARQGFGRNSVEHKTLPLKRGRADY